MENELAVKSVKTDVVETVDYKAKAIEWLKNMGQKLPQNYATQFLELCQAYKLNPFKREIYAVGYGGKFNIITGYEVYLKRAERTGKLNGWRCEAVNNEKAVVTIYRKDWSYPFVHEVYMNEVKQASPVWQKMPIFMMKKVCIEQGFRLCFPDEMGGMPYTDDELGVEKPIQAEIIEQEEIQEQPSESNELTDKKIVLENLENEFGKYLARQDIKSAIAGAYESQDVAVVEKTVQRVKTYLTKRGLEV